MKNISRLLCAIFWIVACMSGSANAIDKSILLKDETTIGLVRTAYFTFPNLTCGAEPQKKQLWLDGMDTGVRSIGCEDKIIENVISKDEKSKDGKIKMWAFTISREGAAKNEQTKKVWLTLLSDPFRDSQNDFKRTVEVSLKDENGETIARQSTDFQILESKDLWFAAIISIATLALLAVGYKSGMLRDSGIPLGGGERPFSLARVQMVWWFTITIISYVVIWLTMHELPEIPASVLALIGMAGGTALIAASVDKSNGDPLQKTAGFWKDITTDAHGVTLPRLQQIVWTLVFGLVFIQQMLRTLSMPDFDSHVLALMGISAGAYLGFKVPESHVPEDAPTPTTPQPPANDDPKQGYGLKD